MTQTPKTKLDDLNLVDKFLFDETMDIPEAHEAAVSILLENEVEFLTKPEKEKELRISPELRQIRLDVIGMDTNHDIYYTEMQQRNTYNLPKRSRYYQAQLDASLLEPGCINFNLLNDTCLILVAPFDIFGRGLYRYTFEGTCRECPDLKIQDGATRIFINTRGTNRKDFSQEFLDFMEYITASTDTIAENTKSRKIKLIHRNVRKIKDSEKMGVKFMQRWEEQEMIRQEGREEGRTAGLEEGRTAGLAEGRTAGLAEGIKNFIQEFVEEQFPKEKIIEKLEKRFSLTEEEAKKYYQMFS